MARAVNLRTRLVQLREEYGEQLELLGIMDGARDTERRLHHQFDHLRRFSEWFRPEPELLAFIAEHTRLFLLPSSERRPLPARTYENQQRARRLYYAHPDWLSDSELAGLLQVSRMTANRYRHQLHAVKVHPGRYRLVPRREEIDEALDLLHVAISSALLDPHSFLHTPKQEPRGSRLIDSHKRNSLHEFVHQGYHKHAKPQT